MINHKCSVRKLLYHQNGMSIYINFLFVYSIGNTHTHTYIELGNFSTMCMNSYLFSYVISHFITVYIFVSDPQVNMDGYSNIYNY